MIRRMFARMMSVGLLALSLLGGTANATQLVLSSDRPDIQMWYYPTGSANGIGSVRDRASTFATYSGIEDGEPVFYPGNGTGFPGRRGEFIMASNTADDVPTGLNPSRYRIDSLKISTTLLGQSFAALGMPYDNTIDTAEDVTTNSDNDDAGHPLELYGIGFRADGDYSEGFAFDLDNPQSEAFELGDYRWSDFSTPYHLFGQDANGNDVTNSPAGGYSATEADNNTEPFTPVPFALGRIFDENQQEIAPGTLVNPGDTVSYEPDLNDSGVLSYIQQSLSEGYLGFSLSSLHQPAGHTGTVPYPDIYTDPFASAQNHSLGLGDNPDGPGPAIELAVTILPPGDYDASGFVDHADYELWKSQFGGTVLSADGNSDGVVNLADYTVWRDNLGAGTPPPGALRAGSTAVPEPSSPQLMGLLGLAAIYLWMGRLVYSPKELAKGLAR